MPDESQKPLEGVRILAIESFAAGPYASMLLAGLGAEVIKIEHAASGGDATRNSANDALGPGDGAYYQSFNLGKRSVTLDLAAPGDRRRFEALVKSADAVMNNLRGSVPARIGLDYASLSAVNPAIVCLHVSAYGRDNARSDWPGFDFLMQAEAGLMDLTGEPDGPPSRAGVSIIDSLSGTVGVIGLLSCLLRARRTGRGCDVDTCLFDVALHQLSYVGIAALNGAPPATRRPRSAHALLTPVQTFRTADGWLFVMCMTQRFWEVLCEAIGRPELQRDVRFLTLETRLANRPTLTALLDALFGTAPTAAWLERLSGKVPIAPVLPVDQALANPFVAETGMVETVPHPKAPAYRVLASPLRIDGVRPAQTIGPALGADNHLLDATPPLTGHDT